MRAYVTAGRGDRMEQFDVDTLYGNVRVYKKGAGERKLLLLHGAGCDHAMLTWRGVMERLRYDEYTAYAYDLPGYGKSGRPAGLAGGEFYSDHAAVVEQVREALGLEEFTLAGLSMGGAIAIRYAIDNPDRVNLLIPVDTWGVTKRMPYHRLCYRYLKKTKRIGKWYARFAKSRLLAKWVIGYSLIGDKRLITPELVDEVRRASAGEDAHKSMCDYIRSSLTKKECIPCYEAEWSRLPMPVVFVQGEKDQMVRAADVRRAAEAVPTGTYCELSGCKHWSVREQPGEFVRIIAAHKPHE